MDVLVNNLAKKVAHKGAWNRVNNSASMSSGAYRTELNVTGQGWLLFTAIYAQTLSTQQRVGFRITVDGGTPYVIGDTDDFYAPAYVTPTDRGGHVFPLDVYFSTSIRVESYNHTGSSQTVAAEVDYLLV